MAELEPKGDINGDTEEKGAEENEFDPFENDWSFEKKDDEVVEEDEGKDEHEENDDDADEPNGDEE